MTAKPNRPAFYSPYPGLRPFKQEEADLFFGREDQIEEMLERLERHRFLAVVGSSGCGKSSLVRAGLLPEVELGLLAGSGSQWRIAVIRPGDAPFRNLVSGLLGEAALGPQLGGTPTAGAMLRATLTRGPLGLLEAVEGAHLPQGSSLLLVVDQFEEIFRFHDQTRNPDEADAFVQLLLASAHPPTHVREGLRRQQIYVLLTMRSDFIGKCALFRGLPERISESQFLTPRMSRSQCRDAIERPARLLGGELESSLVNRMLNDLSGTPDQLPVLQHALMRMWTLKGESQGPRHLTLEDYRAAGELTGALSLHADQAYGELDQNQQSLAETLFRCLCERSSEQVDTRRPVRLEEVAEVAAVEVAVLKPVVEVFRHPDRCFLTPPAPEPLGPDSIIDISHEALIRNWRKLNGWVGIEAESAESYRRLEDGARTWNRLGRDQRSLHNPPLLDLELEWQRAEHPTERWARRYGGDFALAMEFLQQSREQRERLQREEQEAQQRELTRTRELAEAQRKRAATTKRFAVLVSLLLIVLLVITNSVWVLQRQRQELEQETVEHRAHTLATLSDPHRFNQEHSLLMALAAIQTQENKTTLEALHRALGKIQGIPLEGWEAKIRGVALSGDGKVLAACDQEGGIRVQTFAPEPDDILNITLDAKPTAITLDQAGKLLVVGDKEGGLYIRNLANLDSPPLRIESGQRWILELAVSAGGDRVAALGRSGGFSVWDIAEPKQPLFRSGRRGSYRHIALSRGGNLLAASDRGDDIQVWSLGKTNARPRNLGNIGRKITVLEFAPGDWLAAGDAKGWINLWLLDPAAQGHRPQSFRLHEQSVTALAFGSNGNLASAGSEGTAHYWPTKLQTLKEENRKSKLRPYSKPIRTLKGDWTRNKISLAASGDKTLLAVAARDHSIRIYDSNAPGVHPMQLKGSSSSFGVLAFSEVENRLVALDSHGVHLWSLDNPRTPIEELPRPESRIIEVAMDESEPRFAFATADGLVEIFDTEKRLLRIETGKERITALALGHGSPLVAVGGKDRSLSLWNLEKQELPSRELPAPRGGAVGSLLFSPDGDSLAAGSGTGVFVWDAAALAGGTRPEKINRHSDHWSGNNTLAFSPDRQTLASADARGAVLIWDLNQPQAEPMQLSQPVFSNVRMRQVTSLVFDSSGSRLAAHEKSGRILVWELGAGNLLKLVCRYAGRNQSYPEWTNYRHFLPEGHPLGRSCKELPLHPSFWEQGLKLARSGQVEAMRRHFSNIEQTGEKVPAKIRSKANQLAAAAMKKRGETLAAEGLLDQAVIHFSKAMELNPSLNLKPRAKSTQLAAEGLRKKGVQLARKAKNRDDVEQAIGHLSRALELAPDPNLDPKQRVSTLAEQSLIREGRYQARKGNVEAARQAFETAKTLNPKLELDTDAELAELAGPALNRMGQRLAKRGDIQQAVEHFSAADRLEPKEGFDPEKEAAHWHAVGLRIQGQRHIRKGEEAQALQSFEEAHRIAPDEVAAPQVELARYKARKRLPEASRLAQQGEIGKAVAIYGEVNKIAPDAITASKWNELCWQGGLWSKATAVMDACNTAVSLEQDNGGYHDSRALAQALTGDLSGAIKGFERYIEWGPDHNRSEQAIKQRRDWIEELREGNNPFDPQTLEMLRGTDTHRGPRLIIEDAAMKQMF